MSLFQWPFKRKTWAGILNPRFVSDVQAANENTLDGLMNVAGLGATDFFLFAGFAYTAGAPGTYGPGVFFLNGTWYYSTGLSEGQALNPAPLDTMQQPFSDGVPRNTYTLLQAAAVNAAVPNTTSPAFAGNMNAYRLDNKTLATLIAAINVVVGNLKSGAFAPIGTTAGTVAAGNDARFGYTIAQINNLFALQADVLLFGGANPFTPVQPYDPATKAYVDASSSKRLASGNTNVGDIGPGLTVNISFGTTLGNNSYICIPVLISQSGNPQQDTIAYAPDVFNKTTTGCSVRIQRGVNFTSNISIDWIVFGF